MTVSHHRTALTQVVIPLSAWALWTFALRNGEERQTSSHSEPFPICVSMQLFLRFLTRRIFSPPPLDVILHVITNTLLRSIQVEATGASSSELLYRYYFPLDVYSFLHEGMGH